MLPLRRPWHAATLSRLSVRSNVNDDGDNAGGGDDGFDYALRLVELLALASRFQSRCKTVKAV